VGIAVTPAVPDVGVLALVPDRWGPYWQPRHHVMSRLARYYRVLWAEQPIDLRERFSPPPRIAGEPPPPEAFHLLRADEGTPRIYRPAWAARRFAARRLAGARRILLRRGCRRVVLYLWRPAFADAIDLVDHDLVCYHIDDEYAFDAIDARTDDIDPGERKLLERVDQVFIHSPALMERKGKVNRNTDRAPNGVDYAAYASPREEPEDLGPIRRPRIGYTGFLKKQLDWPLIGRLVERHADWSFVFVGPVAPHAEVEAAISALGKRENVFFLGGRPVDRLGAYAQHFDVCVMPYRVDDYTQNIYPLKLHEFLATGRPIVAAPIRSLEEFTHVVSIACTDDEWSAEFDAALRPDAKDAARVEARRSVAARHDWERIVFRIAERLGEHLSAETAEMVRRIGPPETEV